MSAWRSPEERGKDEPTMQWIGAEETESPRPIIRKQSDGVAPVDEDMPVYLRGHPVFKRKRR